jgi:hypothetical protein
MQPLIDADVLRYEIGAVGEYKNDDGDITYRDFDWVATAFDDRIRDICEAVGATEAPRLYLTGDRKLCGDGYIPNFREAIAVGKPYKGTRKNEKPFHYANLTAYILSRYATVIANGCEADDLICIEQTSRSASKDTIICTRDKDLRQCVGWHYGWECGKQPEFGPIEYDSFGEIALVKGKSGNKIVGGGEKFFFAQLLTGDSVDNIGGLKSTGPVKAYALLAEANDRESCQAIIREQYLSNHPDQGLQLLQEQSDLLWIVKELNEDGSFKRFLWQNT